MKLPEDSHIAIEKLTHYLLVRQTRGDKSAFLALSGHTLSNAEALWRDLAMDRAVGTYVERTNDRYDRALERHDEVHCADSR